MCSYLGEAWTIGHLDFPPQNIYDKANDIYDDKDKEEITQNKL